MFPGPSVVTHDVARYVLDTGLIVAGLMTGQHNDNAIDTVDAFPLDKTEFADFDNDGDPDLLVLRQHASNQLLVNDGSCNFEDRTQFAGLEDASRSLHASWIDIDIARSGFDVVTRDLDITINNHLAVQNSKFLKMYVDSCKIVKNVHLAHTI